MKQYLEQPGTTIGAWLEPMKRLPRLQVRFLHEILGFGTVANGSRSSPKQRVEMRHRSRFELFLLISTAKNHVALFVNDLFEFRCSKG